MTEAYSWEVLNETADLYGNIAERQIGALSKSKDETEKNLDATRQKITDLGEAITESENAIKTLETAFESLEKSIEEGAAQKTAELAAELEKLKGEDTVTKIEADIASAEANIDKLKKKLDDIARGVTVPARVDERKSGGGPVGAYASGGRVFGPGGIDRVPAMLTAGEYVIRKAAVDRLGLSFFHAINSLDFSSIPRRLPAFDVPELPFRFAAGGPVPSAAPAGPVDTVNVNFNIGGRSYPLTGPRDRVNQLKNDLMELARGMTGG